MVGRKDAKFSDGQVENKRMPSSVTGNGRKSAGMKEERRHIRAWAPILEIFPLLPFLCPGSSTQLGGRRDLARAL